MTGIILAAGNGTRFYNSSHKKCCKILETVNGIRLIEYALNNLTVLGIDKVYIVIGKSGDLIKESIGTNYKNIQVHYVNQPCRKGLVNAFIQALKLTDDDVILQLADEIFVNFYPSEIKNSIKSGDCDFFCGITYENDPEKIKRNYSVECDETSKILKCIEKPETVINNIKGTGFCFFKYEATKILKELYNETDENICELCDFINLLVSKDKKGFALCIAEKEFNINTVSDLEEAQRYYK